MNILVNMGHESVGLIVKLNAVNITNIVFSLMANRLFDQTVIYINPGTLLSWNK